MHNEGWLHRLFQPKEPLSIPHGRAYKVALRTVHLMAISVLVGGHAFSAPVSALRPWLYVAIATGAGMILLETGRVCTSCLKAGECFFSANWPCYVGYPLLGNSGSRFFSWLWRLLPSALTCLQGFGITRCCIAE